MSDSSTVHASRSGRVLDTTLVMATAALLVANSHLEHFYPFAWMAGDGLIGNSLFFLLAGYGLVRSERFSRRRFFPWLWRRIVRIHPALWIVMIVFALLADGEWRSWSVEQYVKSLIWPTRFTFVQLVFPFYLVFFGLMKLRRAWLFPFTICALIVPYLLVYVPDAMAMTSATPLRLGDRPLMVHAIAYFQVMLLGGWLGWRDGTEVITPRLSALALVTIGCAYVLVKLAMVVGHGARGYILLHALTLFLCFLVFEVLAAPRLTRRIREWRIVWPTVALFGGLTLEIYLVHTFIAEYRWIWTIRFPFNIAVFWALTIPVAALVGTASRRAQERLRGSSPRSAALGVALEVDTKTVVLHPETPVLEPGLVPAKNLRG